MEADDAIDLGPDAPALELPWHDPEERWHYIDLRGESGAAGADRERNLKRAIDRIPETRQFPPLQQFLLQANSPPSVWQTAKCGVLPEKAVASENPYHAAFAHNSYVDLVLAEEFAQRRDELEVHQRLARELAVMLWTEEDLEAYAEVVVRRCYFHKTANPEESDAGYSLTLFLTGYGAAPEKAAESLQKAMELASASLLKLQIG